MKLLLLNVLLCVTMNGLFEYKHHHITKYQLDNPDPDSSILSFIPERIISTLYLNGKFLVEKLKFKGNFDFEKLGSLLRLRLKEKK